MQHVTDDDFQGLLQICEGIGFRTDLVPRQPNQHPNGTLNALQSQQLRAVLSDYAEFIVPVFWSHTEFVGLTDVGDVSSLNLLRRGHQEIVNAGLIEGQAAPRPGWANMPNYVPYVDWAYARNSVSGLSTQANLPGVRRQGWLVVGRKKVSILSLYTDFEPSLDQVPKWGVSEKLLRDPHWQYTQLAFLLPPDDEVGTTTVEMELGYGEIETLRPIELVRFDGLAALLRAADGFQITPDDGDRQFLKWQREITNWLWQLPAPIRSVAKALKYAELGEDGIWDVLLEAYINDCELMTHGTSVANGTGIDEDGLPNRFLFTSALGLAFESSVDGKKIFVESPFSEIDTAWELITHQINSARQESNNSAKQVAPAGEKSDLAEELAKLASLHQSGILSDGEFAAAKAAVIGAR